MHQSPLHAIHVEHGASLVEFAGWEMPIRYGSVIEEHRRVRAVGGMFDVSHMGRVEFRGEGAEALLERVLTRRIGDMKPGRCRYALVCNEAGGVLDDVIVYRYEDRWMLVVNASNRAKILKHLEGEGNAGVDIEDITMDTAMVAVQGPGAMGVLEGMGLVRGEMVRYSFVSGPLIDGESVTVSRTGYTGEDGVEVVMSMEVAEMLPGFLEKVRDASPDAAEVFRPCGLAARDSLRLEAGMPLYGHELSESTNPLEAGLGFAVSLDKPGGFIGQEALRRVAEQGPSRKLVGLRLEGKRTPRQGTAVLDATGRQVGEVTSGCLSPTLGVPIAMAYVSAERGDDPGFAVDFRQAGCGGGGGEAAVLPL